MKSVLPAVLAIGGLMLSAAQGADLYVGAGQPYSTIQAAITAAAEGDTIHVLAGTYDETVTVNKPLTLLGAQAGVQGHDPARASGSESIITGLTSHGGVAVTASNVTLDGFIIEEVDSGPYGVGIWLGPGGGGATVTNNIVRNNTIGLYPRNNGTAQTRITRNLIQSNNRPGAASGDGIYSDVELKNVLIDDNHFIGNNAGAIVLLSQIYGPYGPVNDLTVTNNYVGELTGAGGGFGISGNVFNPGGPVNLVLENNVIDVSAGSGSALKIIGVEVGVVAGNDIAGNLIAEYAMLVSYISSGIIIEDNAFVGGQRGVYLASNADPAGVVIHSNSFVGQTIACIADDGTDWPGPATIDASGNALGSADPALVSGVLVALGATPSTFDFSPLIENQADQSPGSVGFQADLSSLTVHALGSQAGTVGRVQEGIDMVIGSTVNVLPGIYEEQLEISSSGLRLIGSGAGSDPVVDTIIQSPVTLPLYFTTGTLQNHPIVYIHDAVGVSIENVRIDGLGRGNGNYRYDGIAFWNAGGAVENCAVTRIEETPFSGAQHGVGIYAYNNTGGPYTIDIIDTVVDQYQKNAMALSGAGLTANVSGCTVTGYGPIAVTAQNGIQVSYTASGSVTDCVVTGHEYTGPNWASTGILIYQAGAVDVSGCTSVDNQVGIDFDDTNGTVEDTTVSYAGTNASWGISAWKQLGARMTPASFVAPLEEESVGIPNRGGTSVAVSDTIVTGNDVAGSGGIGFYSYAGTLAGAVTNCAVTHWDEGIDTYESGGTVDAQIHLNTITGNLSYGLWSNTAGAVDATDNYWGAASGPEDAIGSSEAPPCAAPAEMKNEDGAGDSVTDASVNYCPWLDAPATLRLLPQGGLTCYEYGDTLVVELQMVDATTEVVGGQFYLQYDCTRLDLVDGAGGIVPGSAPFTVEVSEIVNQITGTIDYAVGVPTSPGTGTAADTVMARVYFTVIASDVCGAADLVTFRTPPGPIQTRLTTAGYAPLYPVKINLPALMIDSTAPAISVESVVGSGELDASCGATVPVHVVVTDNCGIAAADVSFSMATSSGTLDYTGLTRNQVNDWTVTITGSATLTVVEACSATVSITVDADDCPGNHLHQELSGTWSDVTPPTFVDFPANRTQNADAGLDSAVLVPAIVPPTGADCHGPVTIEFKRSDRPTWNTGLAEPYPVGLTTITWKATDACLNYVEQVQTVTVSPFSDVIVDIELQGDLSVPEVTRCVTFTFVNCAGGSAVLERDVTFVTTAYEPGPGNRGVAHVVFTDLPYGEYDCVTAEDELHTLTSKITPGTLDCDWVVDFTEENMLIQGDLTDAYDGDPDYVDILDFGVYINQWGHTYAGSSCGTAFPHADMDGDGGIGAAEFAFVSANFWQLGDTHCCSGPMRDAAPGGPRDSITVAELGRLGLAELAVADLNGDGVVDLADVEAFMAGVTPKPKPPVPAVMSNKQLQPSATEAAPGLLELLPRGPRH